MINILWNEEEKRLESEGLRIESLTTSDQVRQQLFEKYLKMKLAKWLDTHHFLITFVEDTQDFLTIQIMGEAHQLAFQKNMLPRALNSQTEAP
jgi:hypothetical protein